MSEYIKFEHICKVFPGQKALNDVSFSINKGEVHALLGENGAGKSTLLNIFHGVFPPTSGDIFVDDQQVAFPDAHEAIKFGIAKVHQEINLVADMTVMDNLLLGKEYTKLGLKDKKKMYQDTKRLLDTLKCRFLPDEKVRNLNVGEKQMLQIAKAIHYNAKVISFDEPTSSLSSNEVDTLFEVMNNLKEQGITILYISHKLDEIYRICDRATILRDGQYVGTFRVDELEKQDMIHKMVGRDVSMFAKRHKPSCADKSQVVLEAKELCGKGFSDISFELYKGELLGFFGLVGAKRSETMKAIFGADPLSQGEVNLYGKPVKISSPAQAVDMGIALIPENRKEQGFVKDLNNCDNIALAAIKKFDRFIFQNRKAKIANAKDYGRKVGLTPNDPDFYTYALSGGNQQKVILAKWLSTDADIFIFDEPTKGIDIGAKADIYSLMEEMLAAGKSIIMISSEMPEVIGMSDRIIVMREGRQVAIVENQGFSESSILTYAVG